MQRDAGFEEIQAARNFLFEVRAVLHAFLLEFPPSPDHPETPAEPYYPPPPPPPPPSQQYRWHEASRESIELSFEKILNEKMSVRHKRGFQPPNTGRKSDVEGDPEVTDGLPLLLMIVISSSSPLPASSSTSSLT